MNQRIARILGSIAALALAAAIASPSIAGSGERARANGRLVNTGVDPDAFGKLTLRIREDRSELRLVLRGLDGSSAYQLAVDGVDQATIQTDGNGRAVLRLQTPLETSKAQSLDFDPRGTSLSVHAGGPAILTASLDESAPSPKLRLSEQTFVQSTLLAGGGTARARLKLRKDARRSFDVRLEDVAPGTYELFVDGLLRGTIDVGTTGRGSIKFDTKVQAGSLLLDFDPLGATLDILAGGSPVFSGPFEAVAQGVNQCTPSEFEIFLGAQVAPGKAKARIRTKDDCDRDFRVEVEDVAVGDYDLLVDGVLHGTISVAFDPTTGETEGQIEFDTDPDDPGELLLDFDPEGALIEIAQAGTTLFSSVLDPGDPGSNTTCTETENFVALVATGAAPLASGEARLRTRDDCDEDFQVEAEDVPVGDYDLLVGGILRGTISVALDPATGQVEGEIEFDTDPDDPGELLLDFDPVGQTIEVVQGGTVFLSSTLDPGAGGPTSCTEDDTELPLLNAGVLPAAKGKVRVRLQDDCDQDLRVEIEDVPVGSYDLDVDGTPRGTISVAVDPVTGELEGEIEFDTDPDEPGELLLDFDPIGTLIEVSQGGTVLLSRQLP